MKGVGWWGVCGGWCLPCLDSTPTLSEERAGRVVVTIIFHLAILYKIVITGGFNKNCIHCCVPQSLPVSGEWVQDTQYFASV